MNYLVKHFNFLIDEKYFPGYRVVKPFYAKVEYEYVYPLQRVTIMNITFPASAIPMLHITEHFLEEAKEAAKANSQYMPKSVVQIAEENLSK